LPMCGGLSAHRQGDQPSQRRDAELTRCAPSSTSAPDHVVNDLGIKGLGELGNVGTNAAVANAVYHATGVRIRELPIRLEKLLDSPSIPLC